MLKMAWTHSISHLLLMEMENNIITLEDSLTVSYKIKYGTQQVKLPPGIPASHVQVPVQVKPCHSAFYSVPANMPGKQLTMAQVFEFLLPLRETG